MGFGEVGGRSLPGSLYLWIRPWLRYNDKVISSLIVRIWMTWHSVTNLNFYLQKMNTLYLVVDCVSSK